MTNENELTSSILDAPRNRRAMTFGLVILALAAACGVVFFSVHHPVLLRGQEVDLRLVALIAGIFFLMLGLNLIAPEAGYDGGTLSVLDSESPRYEFELINPATGYADINGIDATGNPFGFGGH